jgi:Asp-tRNA(Asn)/Glu-tRNA(Gln) amidotransferase A subunit family amidase
VDLVKAYINRIKEVNPYLNAVVEDRFDEALEDAQKADKMCAQMPLLYLISNFPLLGVPFTVKESIAVKGFSHTAGWMGRKNIKATKDSKAVEKLRNVGMIPLLVSNTPEFCTSWESYNNLTGRTLNPYHPGKTSGGSSGGEGLQFCNLFF